MIDDDYPLVRYIDELDEGQLNRNDNWHERVKPSVNEKRAKILGAIVRAGAAGVTLDELAEHFNCPPNALSGRITELKKLGLIEHSADRRKTRSGASASVIRAVVAGGGA